MAISNALSILKQKVNASSQPLNSDLVGKDLANRIQRTYPGGTIALTNMDFCEEGDNYLHYEAVLPSILSIPNQPVEFWFFEQGQNLECLCITLLPAGWKFSDSFADLPDYPDFSQDLNQPSFLYKFRFEESPIIAYSSFNFQGWNQNGNTGLFDSIKTSVTPVDPTKIPLGLSFVKLDLSGLDLLNDLWDVLKKTGLDTPMAFSLHGVLDRSNPDHEQIRLILDLPFSLNMGEDTFQVGISGLVFYTSTSRDILQADTGIMLVGGLAVGKNKPDSALDNVKVLWPIGSRDLIIQNSKPLDFPDFQVFDQLLQEKSPVNPQNPFPIALSGPALSIYQISLHLSLDAPSLLSHITFAAGTKDGWSHDLLQGVVSIKGIAFQFDIDPAAVSEKVQFTALAGFEVGGGQVDVSAAFPDFVFSGDLALYQTIDLDSIFRYFLPNAELPEISIQDLSVRVDIKQKIYSLELEVASNWEIDLGGQKVLPLERLYLEIEKDENGTFATIDSVLNIAGVDLILSASNLNESGGWSFNGSTRAGQAIAIGELIADLVNLFGDVSLPKAIEELIIENIRVSFNTQSKDFYFTFETLFPVDEQNNADFVVIIDIRRQSDGSYNKFFSGRLSVVGFEFDVIFDSDPTSTTFIAAYNDVQGHPIKIQELVNYVSPDIAGKIPASLSFTIKDALLAYLQKNSLKNYLFGIDIDGGLNLSDLRLPDLPLIGAPFPPDQTLKLSFQLLAAKASVSTDDVALLNGLLQKPLLPSQQISGIALSTVLQIGGESKTLQLPVGFDKNNSSATGLVPAGSNPSGQGIVTSGGASAANVAGSDGTQWFTIQKSFGPVQLERIGVGYKDSQVNGLLDAALTAGGLTIALNGLSVTSPLTELKPTFDLQGLGIDYRNGPLEIGGAFLKHIITPTDGVTPAYTTFSGLAVVRTEKLSISAIGSYTKIQDQPSIFVYAVLDAPIGGPPFFYVTGLAAGFGYNRNLLLPTIDTLADFPLIKEATAQGGPPQLPADQAGQQKTLTDELNLLEAYIPTAVGEHFLAVGIKFTSFKIVDSFALLTVKFGNRLEFDLLGLSTLQSPPAIEGEAITPVARAQLALKATFIPDEGFLGVQAQLTSNSYILSQACHLTGGFAFFCWFNDIPEQRIAAGDFALTLGGYHSEYNPPAHYPRVPRLGINWQVNTQLSIKGDAYFALTPHALMAGGHLEALWHNDSDTLRAWFKAGTDFLICWKPYHYDAHLYIDIGASYTFDFFGSHTITVDLGADLHLWGPEFSGVAEIHCYIFSVTVQFGNNTPPRLEPILWDAFKKSFLPAGDPVCTVAVQGGLIRQVGGNGANRWVVNPKELVFATHSLVPSSGATLAKNESPMPLAKGDIDAMASFGIAPMGVKRAGQNPNLHSTQNVTITRGADQPAESLFVFTPVYKNMPVGLWGDPQMDGAYLKPPEVNPAETLVKTLVGFEIRPKPIAPPGKATPTIAIADFAYEISPVPGAIRWEPADTGSPDKQGADAWQAANATMTSPNLRAASDVFISALGFSTALIDFGEAVTQDVAA